MPLEGVRAEILTNHKTPISSFLWNPNSKKIYFVASDNLWEIDIEAKEEKHLAGENEYVVSDFIISDDGTKIAFIGSSTKSEVYLLDLNTNTVSQLTNNSLDEWSLSFSPDSKWLSFICGGGIIFGDPGGKIYIMSTEGGKPKKLMSNFDYDDNVGYFWSDDSRYIYFTSQVGVNYHLFSANQYVVFQPNYRGSSGYGEEFKKEVAGYTFRQSLDDIMTGVDYLIEREIVYPDSMGIMGWSAGGDLSNMVLASTNRFKAISTGASSTVPKRFITNATTPTLIHCGENDKGNISQSEELYIALKNIGVPTEFIIYPNTGHMIGVVEYGIGNMRYMMVRMQADFYWFEKWIRGKKGLIDWNKIIEPLQEREN